MRRALKIRLAVFLTGLGVSGILLVVLAGAIEPAPGLRAGCRAATSTLSALFVVLGLRLWAACRPPRLPRRHTRTRLGRPCQTERSLREEYEYDDGMAWSPDADAWDGTIEERPPDRDPDARRPERKPDGVLSRRAIRHWLETRTPVPRPSSRR